jgi:hypothetical protein
MYNLTDNEIELLIRALNHQIDFNEKLIQKYKYDLDPELTIAPCKRNIENCEKIIKKISGNI